MKNLTATLCLAIALLFTSAIIETANAEDKFYAFSVNEEGNTWEAILSIRDKNLEVSISVDCPECRVNIDVICQNAEIGLKNNFKTWCNHGAGFFFTNDKMSGNLEKAKLEGGGNAGGAVFHFIPFSQKKAFKTFRKKNSSKSTLEFVAALAAKQKAELERQRKVKLERAETARKKPEVERQRKIELARAETASQHKGGSIAQIAKSTPPMPLYWAGHEAEIIGEKSSYWKLDIEYSMDGASYVATVGLVGAEVRYKKYDTRPTECTLKGKVSKTGILEKTECKLGGRGSWDLTGNVAKMNLEADLARSKRGGSTFVDKGMSKLRARILHAMGTRTAFNERTPSLLSPLTKLEAIIKSLQAEQALAEEECTSGEEEGCDRFATLQQTVRDRQKQLQRVAKTEALVARFVQSIQDPEAIKRQRLLAKAEQKAANEKRRLAEETRLLGIRAAKQRAEERLRAVAEANRLAEKKRLSEEARLAAAADKKRLAELARQRVEAERQRIAEEARLAAADKKRLAEEARLAEAAYKKRLAELARQKVEAERQRIAEEKVRKLAVAEKKRLAEEARLAEAAEKKRLAAIAQAAEELRLYKELAGAARRYLATVQKYLVNNAETPLLMDIIIDSAGINASLKNGSLTGVRAGLKTLKATLSRTKGYANYVAVLEEKRRTKLAAEARIRREKVAAEARIRSEKLAAEVREKHEDLKSYTAFLKRQIIRNLNINPGLTVALIPLAKELQGGLDSKDPVLLTSLRNRAVAALEKHALTEQYAQVEKMMAGVGTAARTRSRAPPAHIRVDASKKLNRNVSYDDIRFGNYYAVVIGNNNYRHLGKLKTAVNDATEVAKVLRRDYGFKVNLLIDATRAETLLALSKVRATLRFDDNLLIYYAGHGLLDEIGEQGYWLPVDAEEGIPTNWISVGDITVMLRAIRAKHALVVADSCYSGTMVRAGAAQPRTARQKHAWIKRILGKRSRVALVSGGLEPVADGGGDGKHSVFASAFIKALTRNTGVIEGRELFDQIKRPVVLNSDQTPSYSDIRKTGHDGGDFILVRRAKP